MKVLIVEDEPIFRHKLSELFSKVCLKKNITPAISYALTKSEAAEHLTNDKYDIGFFDLKLNGEIVGIDLLQRFSNKVAFPVVLSSYFDDRAMVSKAYDQGAEDFLKKPFNERSIKLMFDKYNYHVNHCEFDSKILSKFITSDTETIKELQKVKFKSLGSAPVHITGETGTGKEVVAQLIKEINFDSERPFIAINCNNFTAELFESHLFGHVKGAFTGAVSSKEGCARQADGGVLFLDEIDKIPEAIQDKFLRFIETQTFRPVGSDEDIKVDLLVVSAGSQDIGNLAEKGKFRRDLKARLCGTTIKLKPIRKRKSDIPMLLDFFMRNHATSGRVISINDAAMEILNKYSWPENTREIKNFVEAQLLSDTKKITPAKLKEFINPEKAASLSDKYQILNLDLWAQFQKHDGLASFLNQLQAEIFDYSFNQTKLDHPEGNHAQSRRNLKIATRAYYRIGDLAKRRFTNES